MIVTHVVQGTVGTNGTSLLEVTLFADNGGDTTGREPSGSGTDQSSELLEELSFFVRGLETKEVGKDTNDSEQLVGGVTTFSDTLQPYSPLHQRQEGGIECICLFKLVGILTKEEVAIVDQFAQDQSEDFSEIETSNHLFERLLARLVGRLINDDVEFGSGQVLVLERIECSPFTVDSHALLGWKANTVHLGDVLRSLHVGGIASSTKDDGNLGVWVDIVGRNEGTGRVVDECSELCLNVL